MKESRVLLAFPELVERGIAYAMLMRIGMPETRAWGMIADAIATSGVQDLINQVYRTPDGVRMMNGLARDWKDHPSGPPWLLPGQPG